MDGEGIPPLTGGLRMTMDGVGIPPVTGGLRTTMDGVGIPPVITKTCLCNMQQFLKVKKMIIFR